MAELDFWYKAAWDKQTRDMDRRAIGVSSILDAAFLYLPFFLTVLRICYRPIFPSCRKWSWTAGENGIKMSKVQDRMLSNQKIKRVPFPIAMHRGVRVLIGVSRVYSFYVELFIYLFILFYFIFFAFFKRTRSARHAKIQCSFWLALTQCADRLILIIVYF